MAELEEPGWPDLKGGFNPAAAVATFLAASNASRQKHALEERIHDQQLRLTIAEAEHERKIEQMNMTAALRMAELNRRNDSDHMRMQLMNDREERLQHHEDFMQDERTAANNAVAQFYDDKAHLSVKPGEQGYDTAVAEILARNSRASRDPGVRMAIKSTGFDHNMAANREERAINAAETSLANDVKNKIWKGRSTDLSPIINFPGEWQQQLNPDKSWTGKWYMKVGDNVDPVTLQPTTPIWSTVDHKDIEELRGRYKAITERRQKLPNQISDPDMGITPIRSTPATRIVPGKGAYAGHHYEIDDTTKAVLRQVD